MNMELEGPSEAELKAHGLYDPSDPNAADRLELIRYLVANGATLDDLIAFRAELPGLGAVVPIRPGVPRYTTAEVAGKTGMPEEVLKRLWRAAGFPEVPADVISFSDADLEMLQLIAAAG